ncbi:hypothetical protein NPIL_353511, partial [Nephila pilipes]
LTEKYIIEEKLYIIS